MGRQWTKLSILPNDYAPQIKNAVLCKGTALFDIILFMISSLYNDNDHWSIDFDKPLLKELIDSYIKNGAKAVTCKLRTEFLKSFFNVEKNVLNCHTSIEFLLSKVFLPSIYSGKILNVECKCRDKSEEVVPFFNSSFLKSEKIQLKCNDCEVISTVRFDQIHFNQIVLMRNTSDTEVSWNKLQKVIILNGTVYILCGIIECVPPQDSDNLNHYIGHLMRYTQWYAYDHSQDKLFPSRNTKNKTIIPYLYVFATHNMVLSDSHQMPDDCSEVVRPSQKFLQE